jgi:hypothetical protein
MLTVLPSPKFGPVSTRLYNASSALELKINSTRAINPQSVNVNYHCLTCTLSAVCAP